MHVLFFVCVLQRLELFVKLGGILCRHFLKRSVNKMVPQEFEILEHFEAKLQKVYKNRFSYF